MKASVAYEARRSSPKLHWHRMQDAKTGTYLEAKGQRGTYCIESQPPDRRHGRYKWLLKCDGVEMKSSDHQEELKKFAAKYDMAMGTTASKATGPAPSASYKEKVRDALAKLGSPTPDIDIAKSEGFLKGKEEAGIDPQITAAIIEGSLHHFHQHVDPKKTTEFALENAREAPTREEWEVIVTNPPSGHRGAILAMGMGETEEVGNKIILRGFYDDSQAARVAATIAHSYKCQVTFGPRNYLYEAAEGVGAAEEDRLTAAQRRDFPLSLFALPKIRELPLDTIKRTRNAPARLEMMHNAGHVSTHDYVEAKRRIAARSKHFGIESQYAREGAGETESPGEPLEVDEDTATELELYIDNDSALYKQKVAILKNLERRLRAGTYDRDKAVKLWMYWVDAGAKAYAKEFGGGLWYNQFPVEVRREVARREEQRERAELEIQLGKA